MPRKPILLAHLTIVVIGALTSLSSIQTIKGQPKTWTVGYGATADFLTIQEAVNNASTGDTVLVPNGIYHENVVINKSISLIGENRNSTIIYGNDTSAVVYANADNVQICNFTIEGNGTQTSGIHLEYSRDSTIKENHVKNTGLRGISLDHSDECTVEDNMVANVTNGVLIVVSRGCNISRNQVSNSHYGLSLIDTGACFLRENNMTGNQYNLKVTGVTVADFVHDIDPSNTINGKPICYLVNQQDVPVPNNASFVGIINSTNVTVDGLEITSNMWGVLLAYATNITIRNVTLTHNEFGIRMLHSQNCTVTESNVTGNLDFGIASDHSTNCLFLDNDLRNSKNGMYLRNNEHCTISRSNVKNNTDYGLYLENCTNSVIIENNIENNNQGVAIYHTNRSSIYHNTFANNTKDVYSSDSVSNWDNGYEGNHWSSYNGTDMDYDGIGDVSYEIDENNIDQHPLMGRFYSFNTSYDYQVSFISNSSISNLDFSLTDPSYATLTFNVTGDTGTKGFCGICIPKVLINGSYVVRFNGGVVTYPQVRELPHSNETHEYLYINYTHGDNWIEISGTTMIPESPSFLSVPLFMTATLLAVMRCKKKRTFQKIEMSSPKIVYH